MLSLSASHMQTREKVKRKENEGRSTQRERETHSCSITRVMTTTLMMFASLPCLYEVRSCTPSISASAPVIDALCDVGGPLFLSLSHPRVPFSLSPRSPRFIVSRCIWCMMANGDRDEIYFYTHTLAARLWQIERERNWGNC